MRYGQIKQAIEDGDYNNYTDRVDVSIEISLFEYGILRDPETTECLFCIPKTDNWEMKEGNDSVVLKSCNVTKEDVIDYLIDETSKRFFSFISSNMNTELDRLDSNCLAHMINSINQWDGWFNN